MKTYGHFDVNKGTFGLYTEMAARNYWFKGYVKPVIKDLKVVGQHHQFSMYQGRCKLLN